MNRDQQGFYAASAKCGRGLIRLYMRICFRPKVTYLNREVKKAIQEGPVIIVSNHTCHYDGPMSAAIFSDSALLMAKDWYEKKIVKWITTGGNYIPIDRFGLDTGWIREAVKVIREGKNMMIFPEGHTSKTGEMDEFKSGFVMLAVMTGAKIVPVYCDGEYHHVFGRRLHVYVGEPTELTAEGKGLTAEYLKQESERFRDMVGELKTMKKERRNK